MNTHLSEDQLHRYVDNDLDSDTRASVARHVKECPACGDRLSRLEALAVRVGALPSGIAPPNDLWPELRRRIESNKVRALGQASGTSQERPWWSRPGAALAAAAILVLATASATAWLLAPAGPAVRPSLGGIPASLPADTPRDVALLITDYEGMTERLAEEFEATRNLLPAEAVRTIEDNLRVIDEALGELRAVLLDDPGNHTIIELLSATYRQKVSVLEHANESIS